MTKVGRPKTTICPTCKTNDKAPGRAYCKPCERAKVAASRRKDPVAAVLATIEGLPERPERPFRPVPKPEPDLAVVPLGYHLVLCRCGRRFGTAKEDRLCQGCR